MLTHKTKLFLYFSIFISLFFASSFINNAQASTYYVDNISGLDANDGLSTGAAWKTLSKATTIASAGDTVNVINNGKLYPFRERLAPARSGTSGSLIRFVGSGGSPYLVGTDDYSNNVTSGWIWHASSVSGEYYLTRNNANPGITQPLVLATSLSTSWDVDGVDSLTNRTTGTIGSLSAGQWNWGNNDSLGYSTIYYRLASGESDITTVHIEGGVDGATRRNPILVAWQYVYIENFKVRFSNHHGILNQTLSNNVTYVNVDSSYTGRSGISIGIFSNLTVRNSRFDHNGMISTVRADYSGIQLSGTTNSTITNNVVSNGNNDSGINIKAASNSNLISNNIVFNNSQHGIDISTSSLNNTVYNNTFYNNGEQGINIESTSTGNIVKNNIMANNQAYQLSVFDSGSVTGLVLDNNAFYFSNASTNMIRYAGSFYSMNTFSTYKSDKSQDANSIAVIPNFLNSSGSFSLAEDFKLLSSSSLINVGASVSVTADYLGTSVPQGSNADIGAYEFLLPDSASSLVQYRSDGSTTISTGASTTDTTVVLKFNMTSTNGSDSLTPQVEIQEQGVSFTNSQTNTGDAVLFTSSPVTGQVTVSGLNTSKSYHWQVRVVNAAGSGQWVQKGGSPDFSVISASTPTPAPAVPLSESKAPSTYCSSQNPVSVANLFQIDMKGTTAKLYFSPIANTKDFYISYSKNKNAEEHSVYANLNNIGVQSFTINLLNPNSKYYFKVRGVNGCAFGDWSNIMSANTSSFSNVRLTPPPRAVVLKNKTNIAKEVVKSPIAAPAPTIIPVNDAIKTKNEIDIRKCYFWGLICF